MVDGQLCGAGHGLYETEVPRSRERDKTQTVSSSVGRLECELLPVQLCADKLHKRDAEVVETASMYDHTTIVGRYPTISDVAAWSDECAERGVRSERCWRAGHGATPLGPLSRGQGIGHARGEAHSRRATAPAVKRDSASLAPDTQATGLIAEPKADARCDLERSVDSESHASPPKTVGQQVSPSPANMSQTIEDRHVLRRTLGRLCTGRGRPRSDNALALDLFNAGENARPSHQSAPDEHQMGTRWSGDSRPSGAHGTSGARRL